MPEIIFLDRCPVFIGFFVVIFYAESIFSVNAPKNVNIPFKALFETPNVNLIPCFSPFFEAVQPVKCKHALKRSLSALI